MHRCLIHLSDPIDSANDVSSSALASANRVERRNVYARAARALRVGRIELQHRTVAAAMKRQVIPGCPTQSLRRSDVDFAVAGIDGPAESHGTGAWTDAAVQRLRLAWIEQHVIMRIDDSDNGRRLHRHRFDIDLSGGGSGQAILVDAFQRDRTFAHGGERNRLSAAGEWERGVARF